MRNVQSIYLKGIWLRVGMNTPWQEFLPRGSITDIKVTNNDPRNFNGSDVDMIFITFEDGYILEIKTIEYMVVYK